MGRHATVAGRQAASANIRSRVFTKVTRELTVASKLGGSDPASNPRLRLAMDHAREANMPKDNVERAVKKGAGELEGVNYEEGMYEGYGPGGIAVLVEILTDNKNRTAPELKKIFQKAGSTLAEQGAVGWMFKRKGAIHVQLGTHTEEQIMDIVLEAGADDVVTENQIAQVYCDPSSFSTLRATIEKAGLKIEKSGLELVPENLCDVAGNDAEKAAAFINALEDHDDVQNVFHNANFAD